MLPPRRMVVLGVAAAAAAAAAGCGSAAPRAPAPPDPAPADPAPPAKPALPRWTPDARTTYVTIGHGEITSPESVPPGLKGRSGERGTKVLEERLGTLGHELKELEPGQLARDVPRDARIVFVLGPSVPLRPAEWAALGRYLDRGGRLVIALDPLAGAGLGALEGRLGVRFHPAHLTDDRDYLPTRGTASDHRHVIASDFSTHPSTAALAQPRKGMVVLDAGALEEVPFATPGAAPARTVTIRSSDASWLDLDDDLAFDDGTEQRGPRILAVAVEGPDRGFRALVFADADLFADVLVRGSTGRAERVLISGPMLEDVVGWLTGT